MSVWNPPQRRPLTPREQSLELQRRPPPKGLAGFMKRLRDWKQASTRYQKSIALVRVGSFLFRVWTQHGMPIPPEAGKPKLYIGKPDAGVFVESDPLKRLPPPAELLVEPGDSTRWTRFHKRLDGVLTRLDRREDGPPPPPPRLTYDPDGTPRWVHPDDSAAPLMVHDGDGSPHWLPAQRFADSHWAPR